MFRRTPSGYLTEPGTSNLYAPIDTAAQQVIPQPFKPSARGWDIIWERLGVLFEAVNRWEGGAPLTESGRLLRRLTKHNEAAIPEMTGKCGKGLAQVAVTSYR